jgi:hypothetical protein
LLFDAPFAPCYCCQEKIFDKTARKEVVETLTIEWKIGDLNGKRIRTEGFYWGFGVAGLYLGQCRK